MRWPVLLLATFGTILLSTGAVYFVVQFASDGTLSSLSKPHRGARDRWNSRDHASQHQRATDYLRKSQHIETPTPGLYDRDEKVTDFTADANIRKEEPSARSTNATKTRKKRPMVTRKQGRDVDLSIMGLVPDAHSGVSHAWSAGDPHRCLGSAPVPECVDESSKAYFRRRALLAIITGAESAFRVEVSNCTWLSHFPSDRVVVFSDLIPVEDRRGDFAWEEGLLPRGVYERDGDVFSFFLSKGYLREVRRSGQGYSASWIVAQFRFLQALEYMLLRLGLVEASSPTASNPKTMFYNGTGEHVVGHRREAKRHEQKKSNRRPRRERNDDADSSSRPADGLTTTGKAESWRAVIAGAEEIEWVIIGDDDTVFQLDGLVRRLKSLEKDTRKRPLYLSQTGWGGAGHLFSRAALVRLRDTLSQCIDRWMVRQFKASDAMLVKCAEHSRLEKIKDPILSHCPAMNLRESGLLSPTQASVHAKKDFYAPVNLATWRIGLYYYAFYCRSAVAAKWAVWFSGCAFGSCKHPSCDKAHDAERQAKWLQISENGTTKTLPFAEFTGQTSSGAIRHRELP